MAHRKAIATLQQLLAENPDDVRLHQKLGELYQKQGDSLLAADSFARVAHLYSRDGFFLKAVAILKQVLKMNPKLTGARVDLANWYERLGLKIEAIAQYRILLSHYRMLGAVDEVIQIDEALARLGVRVEKSARQ